MTTSNKKLETIWKIRAYDYLVQHSSIVRGKDDRIKLRTGSTTIDQRPTGKELRNAIEKIFAETNAKAKGVIITPQMVTNFITKTLTLGHFPSFRAVIK